MEKEELRRLVFEVLKQDPQTHVNALEFRVRSLAQNYQRYDALKIQEIVWDLLVQGVLAPGKNSLNLNLPFFHVTEYGEECLQSGDIILQDYDRYLHDLEASIDEPLDQTIRTYVHGAQKAFLSGNYLATMVLLSSAAKQAIDLLDDLLTDKSQNEPDRQHTSQEKLYAAQESLSSLDLTNERRDQIALHLEGLQNLMGHTQDGNGRTRALSIERQTAKSALLVFPTYLKSVYYLIERLESRYR
jgi:hypothetical protein